MNKKRKSKSLAIKTKPQSPAQRSKDITLALSEFFEGPIPDPQTLSQYGVIDPSFPNRIVKMTEDQASHRQKMERRQINHGISLLYLGRIIGFICVVMVCSVGAYSIHLGHDKAGAWIIVVASVGLAGLFVTGKYRNKAA